ncbi:MAG: lipid A export permease/ATP-binding protein MsbA [Burkholderiaceae bacterium]
MNKSLAIYRRLLGYTFPYRKGFALAIAGMVVAALTEPFFPALMKPLLDEGFVAQSGISLWLVPAIIILIFVVRGVGTFAGHYGLAWVANNVLASVRRQMFGHALRLPASEFEREAAGLLISRIVFEVNNLMAATTNVLSTLVRDSLIVIGLLTWLMILNWQLTLVALALIPVMAVLVRVFGGRLRKLGRQNLQHTGELTRVVEEAMHGYKVIKIFGAYEREQALFDRTVERLRGFAMREAIAGGAMAPISQLTAAIAVAAVVSIALVQSASGQTTVGGFVSFVTAMLMLLGPLKHLADLNGPLQRGLAAAENVFALLDRQTEPDPGTRSVGRVRGDIRFENVSFRYPGASQDSLAGVDLQIRSGEMVAFVGGSGGGKTTLANLLPRFHEPTGGRILIDDIPIAELTLESLRDQFALVSQDIVLFNDTVRANTAFGVRGPVDDAAIREALRKAALERFVESLPDGLDTMVGERGAKLSGGQRQRLAIARALLKDAPILLLDEATSALDTGTEREVQEALEQGMSGRTTLVIAHRLSTIEQADRIVVLEGGRIVEQGSHAELIALGGAYAGLHRAQAGRAA